MDNATPGTTAGAATASEPEADTVPIYVTADDDTVEMPPVELHQTTFGVSVCIRALRASHAEKAKEFLRAAFQAIFAQRGIAVNGSEFEVERHEFGHYHAFGAADTMCTENEASSVAEELEIVLKALKADTPVIVSGAVHTATLMQREATSLADVIGMFFLTMSERERAMIVSNLPPEVRQEAEELLREMKASVAQDLLDGATDGHEPPTGMNPKPDGSTPQAHEFTIVEPGSEPSDFAQKPPTS